MIVRYWEDRLKSFKSESIKTTSQSQKVRGDIVGTLSTQQHSLAQLQATKPQQLLFRQMYQILTLKFLKWIQ